MIRLAAVGAIGSLFLSSIAWAGVNLCEWDHSDPVESSQREILREPRRLCGYQ